MIQTSILRSAPSRGGSCEGDVYATAQVSTVSIVHNFIEQVPRPASVPAEADLRFSILTPPGLVEITSFRLRMEERGRRSRSPFQVISQSNWQNQTWVPCPKDQEPFS